MLSKRTYFPPFSSTYTSISRARDVPLTDANRKKQFLMEFSPLQKSL